MNRFVELDVDEDLTGMEGPSVCAAFFRTEPVPHRHLSWLNAVTAFVRIVPAGNQNLTVK